LEAEVIAISGPAYARVLTVATGAMNVGLFVVALVGVQYWGTRFTLWALLVCILWGGFVALPLCLVAFLVETRGRD
jgi:cadmium resistance protein CadD (predicted permease)